MRRKLSIIAVLLPTVPAYFALSAVSIDRAAGAEDPKSATGKSVGAVRLQARVVDTAGKPVLNAAIEVQVLTSRDDTQSSPVELAETSPLKPEDVRRRPPRT